MQARTTIQPFCSSSTKIKPKIAASYPPGYGLALQPSPKTLKLRRGIQSRSTFSCSENTTWVVVFTIPCSSPPITPTWRRLKFLMLSIGPSQDMSDSCSDRTFRIIQSVAPLSSILGSTRLQ
ncbi:hypothetical protein PGTUg99_030544 [Puccinia graminis f. sp. tritici]|uniref:Uncharacterized protein n=1 Tax=Puccinia graminis f. sp. tritici TaxID=56615 RepID=A0A5B0SLB5_PUCGR|nr:hypothetical protein PGTUg99_030544 [Puccinia graminis f. sp. tritici]